MLQGASAVQGGRAAGSPRNAQLRLHILVLGLAINCFIPLWWLFVASTKSNAALFGGTGGPLLFDDDFDLIANLQSLANYNGGIYLRWLGNSALYSFAAGLGATTLAVLAGYGFAKYDFFGKRAAFVVLLGAVMVPATALVIPTFIVISQIGLLNTGWAVILPSLLHPFGVFLISVYAREAVPDDLLDAARVDGAGELRAFTSISLALLRPAIVTVLLLAVVGTWNNFFLPLVVLSDVTLLPVTVGLSQWQAQSTVASAGEPVWNLVVTGSLVSIVPLIVAFVSLQRFWRGGLALGGLKS
jgi:multiple sugar transport system permease protein